MQAGSPTADSTRTPEVVRHRRTWMPYWLARVIARCAGFLSRRSGRGATSLPGMVLLTLHPRGLGRLARRVHASNTVLVSATNGKTTVCAMIASIAQVGERSIVHNMAGANLRSGIATTLLTAATGPDLALLETDEATLPRVAPDLDPTIVVMGNLFRDQLDRYGELETLADRWRTMLDELDPRRTCVVFDADDPLIAELVDAWVTAHAAGGRDTVTIAFGCDDAGSAAQALPHAVDSTFCRRCGTALTYTHSWIGHLGDWSCHGCGFSRPPLDVRASGIELDGLASTTIELTMGSAPDSETIVAKVRAPGLYNVYNALAAAATAQALGISIDDITEGINGFSPAFGRFERIPIPGTGTLTLLLVKNPTGLNEVVRTLTGAGVDLSATLFALNDGIADGRDTSWIWDADIEPLLEATPSGIIATGTRAGEFALRAVYGGVEAGLIDIEPDLETAMFELLDRARTFTAHGHAYALVTYTALLTMRELITRQGWAQAYWHAGGGITR